MAFSLPKSSLHISEVSFARLNIYLIERSIDRYGLDITTSLPKALDSHMKVLTDGIRASIPKAYPFD
jgi:hypothetical protein